jgi:hypothetical protein
MTAIFVALDAAFALMPAIKGPKFSEYTFTSNYPIQEPPLTSIIAPVI